MRGVSRDDYLYLVGLLRDHLGHELGEGKEYLVEARLGPIASVQGLASVGALVRRLRQGSDPALREVVLEALLTGETSFFRTATTFDRLRRVALPALIAARAHVRRLRIWCAACSTGQEPYSIAMMLADDFPALRHGWTVDLLATDTSTLALRRAREGLYTESEVARGLPSLARRLHVHRAGDRWQIADDLRRAVTFRRFNLLRPFSELGQVFDLILMCNVLIYLDAPTKTAILDRLRDVIEPDGYLFLGESETILGLTDRFTIQPGEEPFYRPV